MTVFYTLFPYYLARCRNTLSVLPGLSSCSSPTSILLLPHPPPLSCFFTNMSQIALLVGIIRQNNCAPQWKTLAIPKGHTSGSTQKMYKELIKSSATVEMVGGTSHFYLPTAYRFRLPTSLQDYRLALIPFLLLREPDAIFSHLRCPSYADSLHTGTDIPPPTPQKAKNANSTTNTTPTNGRKRGRPAKKSTMMAENNDDDDEEQKGKGSASPSGHAAKKVKVEVKGESGAGGYSEEETAEDPFGGI